MSTNEWDTRYDTEDHPLWSGRANGVLVAEVASGAPGRALDVGCGEGADAIWLVTCGWQVTGVDVSQIALDRAAAAAALAGVDVQWICADISAAPVDASRYELVSLHYPALKRSPDDHAVQSLLNAVAPGAPYWSSGTLLSTPTTRAPTVSISRNMSRSQRSQQHSATGGTSRSTRPGCGSTRCRKAHHTRTTLCFEPTVSATPLCHKRIGGYGTPPPFRSEHPFETHRLKYGRSYWMMILSCNFVAGSG